MVKQREQLELNIGAEADTYGSTASLSVFSPSNSTRTVSPKRDQCSPSGKSTYERALCK